MIWWTGPVPIERNSVTPGKVNTPRAKRPQFSRGTTSKISLLQDLCWYTKGCWCQKLLQNQAQQQASWGRQCQISLPFQPPHVNRINIRLFTLHSFTPHTQLIAFIQWTLHSLTQPPTRVHLPTINFKLVLGKILVSWWWERETLQTSKLLWPKDGNEELAGATVCKWSCHYGFH